MVVFGYYCSAKISGEKAGIKKVIDFSMTLYLSERKKTAYFILFYTFAISHGCKIR